MNDAVVQPLAGDPYWSNTVLLCHLDGTNGSTAIVDSSAGTHACTAVGSSLSTSQFKFGTASWSSGGAPYITTPDSADWAFGNGQFTVECWARHTATLSGITTLVAQFGGSTQLGWFFGFNGNTLNFFYSTTGADSPVVSGPYTPTQNSWIFYAADRDASNVLRVYADGVVIASATVAATFFDSNRTLRIANDENNTRGFGGYIDEVRITKGIARYAGAFTPPAAAFPDAGTGTLAATETADGASFIGTVLTVVTGTLGATDAPDAASFSGTVIPVITGTLAATETVDGASFSGLVLSPITGTLSATDTPDAATFFIGTAGLILGQVSVKLLGPHDFSGIYWLPGTIFSPQTYVPPDFSFTPLMEPQNSYSATQIAALESAMGPQTVQEFLSMSKVINYTYASPPVH